MTRLINTSAGPNIDDVRRPETTQRSPRVALVLGAMSSLVRLKGAGRKSQNGWPAGHRVGARNHTLRGKNHVPPWTDSNTRKSYTRSSATQERPAGSPLESKASKKANNTEPESQSLNSDSESDIDKKSEAQITLDEAFRQNTLDGVLVVVRLQGSISNF